MLSSRSCRFVRSAFASTRLSNRLCVNVLRNFIEFQINLFVKLRTNCHNQICNDNEYWESLKLLKYYVIGKLRDSSKIR